MFSLFYLYNINNPYNNVLEKTEKIVFSKMNL